MTPVYLSYPILPQHMLDQGVRLETYRVPHITSQFSKVPGGQAFVYCNHVFQECSHGFLPPPLETTFKSE